VSAGKFFCTCKKLMQNFRNRFKLLLFTFCRASHVRSYVTSVISKMPPTATTLQVDWLTVHWIHNLKVDLRWEERNCLRLHQLKHELASLKYVHVTRANWRAYDWFDCLQRKLRGWLQKWVLFGYVRWSQIFKEGQTYKNLMLFNISVIFLP